MFQSTPRHSFNKQLANYYFPNREGFSVGEYEKHMVCIWIKANYTNSCLVLFAVNVSLYSCIRSMDWRTHMFDQMTIHVNILIA